MDFSSLQTAFFGKESPCFMAYPGGNCIYISSSRSPFKNAFEMSNYDKDQLSFAANPSNILTEDNLATGE